MGPSSGSCVVEFARAGARAFVCAVAGLAAALLFAVPGPREAWAYTGSPAPAADLAPAPATDLARALAADLAPAPATDLARALAADLAPAPATDLARPLAADLAPAPAADLARTLAAASASGELDYIEIMTGGAGRDEAVPMIIAVHGLGDRPEQFSFLFRPLALPARVILPRGITPAGYGGYSWFPFVIGASGDRFAAGVASAAHRLSNLINKLHATKPVLGRPIITGFSQGGMLSFAIAALHPNDVSTALPLSGFLPVQLWPDPTLPLPPAGAHLPRVRAFHGEADTVISLKPAEWSVTVLADRGYDAELETYPGVGHTISSEMRADYYDALSAAVLAAANWDGGRNSGRMTVPPRETAPLQLPPAPVSPDLPPSLNSGSR